MAKLVTDKPVKEKPEWLSAIADEVQEEKNRTFEGRCQFVGAKLQFETIVEDINNKYGTEFQLGDIFNITTEEEDQAIEMLGLDDDD